MSALKDPQRRRLTVSECGPVPAGGRTAAGGGGRIDHSGLKEVFSAEETGGKIAISITSVTDKDLKRRRSFADKDEEVLVPAGGDEEAAKAWVRDTLRVSWSCKKGLKPESPNQDSFSFLGIEGKFGLYGVYDGHGPCGHDVSDLSRETLVRNCVARLRAGEEAGEVFKTAFVETQVCLEEDRAVDPSTSGTTCSMAYHDFASDILTIAHVGDSRGVIGWVTGTKVHVALDLTIDHKPNLPEERARIEGSDPPGRVVFDGFYNHRVFAQNGMYPGLNMSRALGDVIAHKEAGLTAYPDVKVLDLNELRKDYLQKHGEGELVLLLCTDGVWEFIESIESLNLIANHRGTNAEACAKLANESWDRWMADSDHEISDDITVLMVKLG